MSKPNPLPIAALPNAWYNDHPGGWYPRLEVGSMSLLGLDRPSEAETFDADEADQRAENCLADSIRSDTLTPCYACGKVSSRAAILRGQREVRHCPRCLRMACAECWDLRGYYRDHTSAEARCCFPSD